VTLPETGHGAPSATQRFREAISLAESFPLGGILSSPAYSIASMSRLAAGLPGTRTGPLSPPASAPAPWRLVNFSPPRTFFSPWHDWHFSIKSGRMVRSKNSTSAGFGWAGAAARANGVSQAREDRSSTAEKHFMARTPGCYP
jgi:hypothetical protein